MKDCLSDRQLVAAFYGDAGEHQRAHLASCLECGRRMRQLRNDLDRIGGALTDFHLKRHTSGRRSAVAALVLAAAAAVAVVVWSAQDSGTQRQFAASEMDWLSAARSVSAVIFDDSAGEETVEDVDSVPAGALASAGTVAAGDVAYVSFALDGSLPCEWMDPLGARDCSTDVLVRVDSSR